VIKNLHMKVHKLGKFLIAGCSFVPFTPFKTNFEVEDEEIYEYLMKISADPKKIT
jgi:Icc-related predicted phosphoesterase